MSRISTPTTMDTNMTEREELEARLAELTRPVLLRIGGKDQRIVGDSKIDKGKYVYQPKNKMAWIPAIPLIEVEGA